MEPVVAPFMPKIGFALRNLIGMVRENIVDTAAVQIEGFPQMLHADGGALDMPARISHAPRAFPFQFLILKF